MSEEYTKLCQSSNIDETLNEMFPISEKNQHFDDIDDFPPPLEEIDDEYYQPPTPAIKFGDASSYSGHINEYFVSDNMFRSTPDKITIDRECFKSMFMEHFRKHLGIIMYLNYIIHSEEQEEDIDPDEYLQGLEEIEKNEEKTID